MATYLEAVTDNRDKQGIGKDDDAGNGGAPQPENAEEGNSGLVFRDYGSNI